MFRRSGFTPRRSLLQSVSPVHGDFEYRYRRFSSGPPRLQPNIFVPDSSWIRDGHRLARKGSEWKPILSEVLHPNYLR